MYEVNRSLVLLKPRQPFLDWLCALPGSQPEEVSLKALRASANALLIPPADDMDMVAGFMSDRLSMLFEAELADWCADETLWPQQRDITLFQAWFDVEIHPIVTDLVDEALEREAFRPFDL
ncbi:VacJ [Aquitalea sp. S1-19]|nr:VacJ [Aquitalea sp. S1-19]